MDELLEWDRSLRLLMVIVVDSLSKRSNINGFFILFVRPFCVTRESLANVTMVGNKFSVDGACCSNDRIDCCGNCSTQGYSIIILCYVSCFWGKNHEKNKKRSCKRNI